MNLRSHLKRVVAVVLLSATLAVSSVVSHLRSADAEQYAVYSAYIEDGLTGDSHSLGDRRGTILIADHSTMLSELKATEQLRFTVGSLRNLQRRTDPPRLSLI